MRKIVTLIVLLVSGFNLVAQENCDCKVELDFVYEKMQSMASFKSQIKGDAVQDFEQKYQNLSAEFTADISKVDCFWKLTQLMGQVKDKHALIYEVTPDYDLEDVRDSAFVANYRKSAAFLNHPKVDLDLEELSVSLSTKPVEAIEGIYNISSAMKLGVYRTAQADSLVGVILQSELGIWEPGQIMLYMKETDRPNEYHIVKYGQIHKNLDFSRSQVFQYGSLFSNVLKENAGVNYSKFDLKNTEAYELSRLNESVQYFWIDHFARYSKEEQRDALVAQINSDLTAPNLIVDLRHNGGGASKISLPILRALKKKSGTKIFVLTNFYSGSNAEQTTVRLKKIKGTVHLGQRTNGTIAYGRNYNTRHLSPSGLFKIAPTDMKFNHFLKYEEVGVQPDIELSNESDWLEQTIDIINGQNL